MKGISFDIESLRENLQVFSIEKIDVDDFIIEKDNAFQIQ